MLKKQQANASAVARKEILERIRDEAIPYVGSLAEYCRKNGLKQPKYSFRESRNGFLGYVSVGVSYTTFPIGYDDERVSKIAVAKLGLQQLTGKTVVPKYRTCTGTPLQIATKIFDMLGPDGVFLSAIPKEFENIYETSLPPNWRDVIKGNGKLLIVTSSPLAVVHKFLPRIDVSVEELAPRRQKVVNTLIAVAGASVVHKEANKDASMTKQNNHYKTSLSMRL